MEPMDHDLLRATAEESAKSAKKKEEKNDYVPRPLYQRILAIVLGVLFVIGVFLFYFWFFKKPVP